MPRNAPSLSMYVYSHTHKHKHTHTHRLTLTLTLELRPPWHATGVSRALRARRVSGSVPESVPENRGVSGSVSRSVSEGPRAPECPKVSPECRKGVPDTPGTLSGPFLDTPEPGARRAPETLRETLPETLPETPTPFSGTLSGTLPETLRARRA